MTVVSGLLRELETAQRINAFVAVPHPARLRAWFEHFFDEPVQDLTLDSQARLFAAIYGLASSQSLRVAVISASQSSAGLSRPSIFSNTA
ncbi:hypothetical protein OSW16_15480 [Pseudomonas putida]|uniref:hypothetical protein n=1 Tax=Pseudomonas putida TaxID=303 RepID=UPI0022720468|nr:hypothetical protein [Pseudomonas putida]WAC00784.1 hypothetical protein OSW16_15480 [Pseudomonas putida]